MRKIRLMVGFPHRGQVDTAFMLSMLDLDRYCLLNGQVDERTQIEWISFVGTSGSLLPKQRDEIVSAAKAKGATHLLFIDTDMVFSPEIAHKLLKARKEVIACNAATKTTPSYPTARKSSNDLIGGEPVYSTSKSPMVEQIWRIGTGIMLIDLEAIRNVPQPWFMMTYNTQHKEHEGEDWYFCRLLKGYNFPVYVHHEASMSVGHIGSFTYTIPLTNKHKEIKESKDGG